jgi:hypothetical protein
MPTYPVINNDTGETQELVMTVASYGQWRKDNPDWDRDWSQGCASVGEIGEWKDKLIKKNPGWNDVLHKASQVPGSKVKPIN